MIFVTVGTQLPFDRLVLQIDQWAGRTGRQDLYAQVGPTRSAPRFIRSDPFINVDAFENIVRRASVVIAHAGMGSIITALQLGKPIVVMPRRASLGEHRNDHQFATARRLREQGRVIVAWDESELITILDGLANLVAPSPISPHASPQLLETIRSFIASGVVELTTQPKLDSPTGSGKTSTLMQSIAQRLSLRKVWARRVR